MVSLKEYMREQSPVSRNKILVIALTSAFAGACLMFVFALAGVL